MTSTRNVIKLSIKEAIDNRKKEYLLHAGDNNVKALLRRLFYRLGYLTYMNRDDVEIIRVKEQIDTLLNEHGETYCMMNVSKLLMGDVDE